MKAEIVGAKFDESDRAVIEQYSWNLHPNGYAETNIKRDGKWRTIRMHRLLITDVPPGLVVDHINRDKLDNRRCNLRICTSSQNNKNSKNYRSESKYRGVARNASGKRWRAQVRLDGTTKYIGTYDTEEEAAKAVAPFFDTPDHKPLEYLAALAPKERPDDR